MITNSKRITTPQPQSSNSQGPLPRARADWPVPAALLALTFVPFLGGAFRLAGLASGAAVTPENARFVAMPLPVVIHIITALLFCVLGAFQFAPGFRRRRPGWHRRVGRVLGLCGLAAGLSALWMTQFYPLHPRFQGEILYGFRMVFGTAMVGSIALSLAAIWRRDIAGHRAWIIRGYAIGQGAGTQAVTGLLWMLFFGAQSELSREVLLGISWIINLAAAEWIIRRRPAPRRSAPATYGQPRNSH